MRTPSSRLSLTGVKAGRAAAWMHGQQAGYSSIRHRFNGMGVVRSTATAVTLFCGEPSITRSE